MTTQKISTMRRQGMTRRSMLKATALSGAALLCAPFVPTSLYAAKNMQTQSQTRIMLGTFVSITVQHESIALAEEALGRSFEKACNLEALLSRHISSSAMTELNTHGKITDAPTSLIYVLERAKRIHSLTNGAFDMTVAA